MHSSMYYEITTKSIQLFAESVQNPNMHYEIFYALWASLLYWPYILSRIFMIHENAWYVLHEMGHIEYIW